MSINPLKERAYIIELSGPAKRGLAEMGRYYEDYYESYYENFPFNSISESALISVLRHLINDNFDFSPKIIRPQAFLPNDLIKKLRELREEVKENSGLILFQGEVFSDSITLEQSLQSIGERPALAQEILPTAIALFLGLELIGLPEERRGRIIQSGVKVNPKAAVDLQQGPINPRSINGTQARGPHGDNVQEEKPERYPDILVFGTTCPHEHFTQFFALTREILEKAGLWEILRLPIYRTTATLAVLKKPQPRIHSVIDEDGHFVSLILNETTTSFDPRGRLALRILRELLLENCLNEEACVAIPNNRTTLHAVGGIEDEDLEKVCARPKIDYTNLIVSDETRKYYEQQKIKDEKRSTESRVITRIYANIGQN